MKKAMKKTVIISGGTIDFEFASSYIEQKNYDVIIGVDGGITFLEEINLIPHYIVGDFDTLPEAVLQKYKSMAGVEIREFQPEKDATDTQLAIELAVELKSTDIDILGASGTRLDHTLGNIQCLYTALEWGIQCSIVDAHNKICLLDKDTQLKKEEQFGDYISLLAFSDIVEGITLSGFKYPLNDYKLKKNTSLGVSNEIIDERAAISLKRGILLMIQSKD